MQKMLINVTLMFLLGSSICLTAKERVVEISQKELHDGGQKLNNKLLKAAQAGYFYLEMPPAVAERLPAALQFAHSWYNNDAIKQHPFSDLSGIKDANICQAEHLICEREHWNAIYPEEIRQLSALLIEEATHLLQKLFPLMVPQLPEELWNEAAPGLFDKTASYFLTFNHYRSSRKAIGLKPHKDSSHITLLYINREGLEAYINGQWQAVLPKNGHLVAFFGQALELLVNDSSKLQAVEHRVTQVMQRDRISFALFAENRQASPVNYVTQSGAIEQAYASYDEFADEVQRIALGTKDTLSKPMVVAKKADSQ